MVKLSLPNLTILSLLLYVLAGCNSDNDDAMMPIIEEQDFEVERYEGRAYDRITQELLQEGVTIYYFDGQDRLSGMYNASDTIPSTPEYTSEDSIAFIYNSDQSVWPDRFAFFDVDATPVINLGNLDLFYDEQGRLIKIEEVGFPTFTYFVYASSAIINYAVFNGDTTKFETLRTSNGNIINRISHLEDDESVFETSAVYDSKVCPFDYNPLSVKFLTPRYGNDGILGSALPYTDVSGVNNPLTTREGREQNYVYDSNDRPIFIYSVDDQDSVVSEIQYVN